MRLVAYPNRRRRSACTPPGRPAPSSAAHKRHEAGAEAGVVAEAGAGAGAGAEAEAEAAGAGAVAGAEP
jgi:hypothetical protein